MTNIIEIRQLHYRAGKTFEIKQLDLNVPPGAIYGFLGPNGSGKTTTIRLALGLLRPLTGRITVLGDAIPDHAPRVLARVGYVPEQPHLDRSIRRGIDRGRSGWCASSTSTSVNRLGGSPKDRRAK